MGAAIGGAVGSFFGPVGTAVGSAVGGIAQSALTSSSQSDAAGDAAAAQEQAAQTAGQDQLQASQESLALQNQQYNEGVASIYQGANGALQTQLPYENAGLNALTAYQQSMGLTIPQGGYLAANPPIASLTAPTPQGVPVLGASGQPIQTNNSSTTMIGAPNQLGALTANGGTPTGTPTTAAYISGNDTSTNFLHDSPDIANGANLQSSEDTGFMSKYNAIVNSALLQSNGNLNNLTAAQQSVINSQYNSLVSGTDPQTLAEYKALNPYANYITGSNTFSNTLMALPEASHGATYNAANAANTGGTAAQMTPALSNAPAGAADTSGALDEYFNSPEYQLIFGKPSAGQLAGTSTPQQNFEQSPSYQFQLAQGLNSVTNSAAASGLLNSTSLANGIDAYAQGFAGTQFNNYLTNLQSNFGNYQGQLASAAGLGQNAANAAGNIMTGTGNSVAGVAGSAANGESNTINQSGANQANSALAAGNAAATGIINQSNANTAGSNSIASLGGLLGQSSGLFGNSSGGLFGSSGGAPVEEGIDITGLAADL